MLCALRLSPPCPPRGGMLRTWWLEKLDTDLYSTAITLPEKGKNLKPIGPQFPPRGGQGGDARGGQGGDARGGQGGMLENGTGVTLENGSSVPTKKPLTPKTKGERL